MGIVNRFRKGQSDRVVQPDPDTPYYVAGANEEGEDFTVFITIGEYSGGWYWTGKAVGFGDEDIMWDQGPYGSPEEAVQAAVAKAHETLEMIDYTNDIEISAQIEGEGMN